MEATGTQTPPRTLLEVFKTLPEGTLVQLIENQLIMTPAPFYSHQKVLMDILFHLTNFVRHNELGEVLVAPLDVYLDDKNAFQPDIIFISSENKDIIRKDGLYGAPDLVIEILSPSTAKYDFNEKKNAYERSGVKEYWIVDPESKVVQGYFLHRGVYDKSFNETALISSRVLDYELQF